MKILFSILLVTVFMSACNNQYTPLPRGYFRIGLPEKEYCSLDTAFPYGFNYPVYAKIVPDTDVPDQPYWVNVVFPTFKATIHISYKSVNGNVSELMEDSRKLAYKHSIKADAIGEVVFSDESKKLYGILYDIRGNAASPLQFAVTDSTKHFLRGALYFNTAPNKDSLAPVVAFIRSDIMELMESIIWK